MDAVAPLINEVFDQLQTIYGRKYTSRFGNENEIKKTKRIWAISFIKEQITFDQIKYALQQVLYMRMAWPPELIEFLALCDHEDVTGIPSLEEAASRIVMCNTKYRFEKESYEKKHLSHPLLAYLNRECAKHVNKTEDVFLKHLKRQYSLAVIKFKTGQLPNVRVALPAPNLPYATQNYQAQNPDNAFMQRVNHVRNLFKAKK